MNITRFIFALVVLAATGCGSGAPSFVTQAAEQLVYSYITAYPDQAGSKKCLAPKQLDGQQWFLLCGFNQGGPGLVNGGLWEIRQEGSSWIALASNGKAARAQQKFLDPQIRPPQAPPAFDVAKARSLFPE